MATLNYQRVHISISFLDAHLTQIWITVSTHPKWSVVLTPAMSPVLGDTSNCDALQALQDAIQASAERLDGQDVANVPLAWNSACFGMPFW